MMKCSINRCDERATHALADYQHNAINDLERYLIDADIATNRGDCCPEEQDELESEVKWRVREFLNLHFSDVDCERGSPLVFCDHHAFGNGREACPCCYDETIQVWSDTDEEVYLKPTYPQGTLDGDGCCSEHP